MNQIELAEKLQRLARDIRNCDVSGYAQEHLSLLRKIGGWKNIIPDQSDIEKTSILGSSTLTDIAWPDTSIREVAKNVILGVDTYSVEEMSTQIVRFQQWIDAFRTFAGDVSDKNKALREYVKSHSRSISPEVAARLEEKLASWYAENEKLVSQHTVWRLHDDGRITYTKGGDLYLMRSVFSEEPAIMGLDNTCIHESEKWKPFEPYGGFIECTLEDALAWRDEFIRSS